MANIDALLELMRRLRDTESGCPWDREQTFSSIAPYTVEEAYEVEDAIQRNDLVDLKSELGDLLFQVVFHAQMASEQDAFTFDDVVNGLVEKMTRRHPHVFADADVRDAEVQTRAWEDMKAEERKAGAGVLDDVPKNLPALMRAKKLSKRAGRAGFEWPDMEGVFAKIDEELAELREAVAANTDREHINEELGDFLFTITNLARYLKVDPEAALRGTNAKFERRFRAVETELARRGRTPAESTLEEMDVIWNTVRHADKQT
ncbi:MAG: nucleoside triphosphate pyrophosphohydrolase [Proteobacteria bacterium]|nr:nucleoside triphosphate pyrophosphohydrolase [Pseudomonadota bacterium]